MEVATSAKGQGLALSVNGEPTYSRCEAYIKDLLKKVMEINPLELEYHFFFSFFKGEVCEGHMSPTDPLAAKHVAAIGLKKEGFKNICNALNHRQPQQQASNAITNENEQTGSAGEQTCPRSEEASLKKGWIFSMESKSLRVLILSRELQSFLLGI